MTVASSMGSSASGSGQGVRIKLGSASMASAATRLSDATVGTGPPSAKNAPSARRDDFPPAARARCSS